jgi:hypothetical protein
MNTLKTMLVVAGILALSACTPPVVTNYATVSTHTLQVAADKQADVVWVQQYKGGDFILMRCSNAPEGPSCVQAKTP